MQRKLPLLLLLASAPLLAQEDAALDDVLGGFDEPAPAGDDGLDVLLEGFDAPASVEAETPLVPASDWQLGGDLILGAAYNVAHQAPASPAEGDHRGLSRLRATGRLALEGKPWESWRAKLAATAYADALTPPEPADPTAAALIDTPRAEAELGEAWLLGSLTPQVDLKLGRQIVVWGKSDNLRVTDVLNPLDQREPGLTDIEDLRLPVTMLKLDAYLGDWNVSAMAIPEIRVDRIADYGSDFAPPLPGNFRDLETVPDDGGENTEYALALNGTFSGWDLSLYSARLIDNTAYRGQATPDAVAPTPLHAQIRMHGLAANVAQGNWLLKGEFAHFSDLGSPLYGQGFNRDDLLLGVEYAGLRDATLSLELVERRIGDYPAALATPDDQRQTAVRYSGTFLHDRLDITLLGVFFDFGINKGGFARFGGEYELAEALRLAAGVVSYWDGEGTTAWGENDRLYTELKYSF